jgi:serine/threonine protein kinase
MLLLEDHPGGEPLDRLLGQPMEIGRFFRFATGLSAALRQLHERGLIHKDIKPANVLANSATGQVWLTGFGIASRLPRERQSPEPPELVAGTLAYMAPEQTGRMNRSIDSRSDLYSLGVTLYEMLTGGLPFMASDPMEWVHCHIARQPVPPVERLKDLPLPLSAIVSKLLAKTAEERYQTAAGVEADLCRCLNEWESRKRIDTFSLGSHDTPDRLLIPEKLYGRAGEIDALLTSFGRVVAIGAPELVLVSGYSGIGKSSVVNELHKVLVPPRGLFASGKFDQYKRDIPYKTIAQAFQITHKPVNAIPACHRGALTSAPILASSVAVSSFSAKAVGHMWPSSRFALSLKPSVAYLVLNFCALWKKQTTLPSLAYAGTPYQVFGERSGALALMIAWSHSPMARSGCDSVAIVASTALSPSALSARLPRRASAFSSWSRSLIATRSSSVNPLDFFPVAVVLLGDFCVPFFAGFIVFSFQWLVSTPSCFSPYLYRDRNAIQRMFCRLKDFRRIATR